MNKDDVINYPYLIDCEEDNIATIRELISNTICELAQLNKDLMRAEHTLAVLHFENGT